MYRVKYVDFGNVDSVLASAMAVLPALLAELPALAMRCCLKGAEPRGGGWSHEACLWFSKLVLEKTVTITVVVMPLDRFPIYGIPVCKMYFHRMFCTTNP